MRYQNGRCYYSQLYHRSRSIFPPRSLLRTRVLPTWLDTSGKWFHGHTRARLCSRDPIIYIRSSGGPRLKSGVCRRRMVLFFKSAMSSPVPRMGLWNLTDAYLEALMPTT